eukprot:716811-Hanusia_phi.AAC.5
MTPPHNLEVFALKGPGTWYLPTPALRLKRFFAVSVVGGWGGRDWIGLLRKGWGDKWLMGGWVGEG